MKLYRIIWDSRAKESLKAIILFIKEESPTAAEKVRKELLKLTASLKKMPERFSTEPYLEHKGNEYRSVTKWSYKIIYRVDEKEVRILEIIHTNRNTTIIEGIA
ncbi:MAG TPA: type II toxin-antitoxin system RelE/ParE family toxin [Cyclobacteriaceae bacterium]|nr:type II toxin-antitoxin system RelE/ParE family toxin [Cyclobacteriaceae bacterium]